jgi:hypothetical protein
MPILFFPEIRPADVAARKAARDVPGLVRLLHDRNPDIQWQAADALGSLGSLALPLLIQELDSRHVASRIGAVEALGAIGDPRAVRHLADVMEHDRNIEVRWVAALALGRIGDPAAIPPLLFALHDPERYIRSSAAMSLDRLGWTPGNETETAYRAIALQDWDAIKRLRIAATGPLTERLSDPDPKIRALVIDLLGMIGDPRAQQACRAGLQDPDAEVRWAAVITAKKCRVPVAQIPWGISKRQRTGQNPWAAGILNFLFVGLGYNYLGYWWGFLVFMSYTSILVLAQLEAGPFLPYIIAYPITALFAVQTFYMAKKMQDL